eukprot:gene31849-39339_t
MRHLDIHGLTRITNMAMPTMAEEHLNLEHFDISECNLIGDTGVVRILTSCTNLQHINLSGTNITDESLNACMFCPKLHTIKLIDCDVITDTGMCRMVGGCPLLKSVDLYGCSGLTDLTLLLMIRICSCLSEVDIGDSNFTDFAIAELIDHCTTLTKLSCVSHELSNGLVLRAMRHAKCIVFDDREDKVTCRTLRWDRTVTHKKQHPIVTLYTCGDTDFLSCLLTVAYIAPQLESVTFRNYTHTDEQLTGFFRLCKNLTSATSHLSSIYRALRCSI